MESHLPMATQLANAGVMNQIPVFLNLDSRFSTSLLRSDWIPSPLFLITKVQCSEEGRAFPPSKTAWVWPLHLWRELGPASWGTVGPQPPTACSTLFSLSGADPEETILNAFKVFDPEGKGVLKAD